MPMPSIFAPMATRQLATSQISGSRAAFSSTVTPSASVAAIISVCVAPTETSAPAVEEGRLSPWLVFVIVAVIAALVVVWRRG